MKSEIIYDGGILEKRDRMLHNLAAIVISENLQYNIRANEKALADKGVLKERALREDLRSHFYFDIKVGSVVYPVLAVGDYGVAYMSVTTDAVLNDSKRAYPISNLDEISRLRSLWFRHLCREFDEVVIANQKMPALADIIGQQYEIDRDAFAASSLWKELEVRRSLLADNIGAEPFMVYRLGDVHKFLSYYPSNPITSVPISLEYQQIILKCWNDFLEKEVSND